MLSNHRASSTSKRLLLCMISASREQALERMKGFLRVITKTVSLERLVQKAEQVARGRRAGRTSQFRCLPADCGRRAGREWWSVDRHLSTECRQLRAGLQYPLRVHSAEASGHHTPGPPRMLGSHREHTDRSPFHGPEGVMGKHKLQGIQ